MRTKMLDRLGKLRPGSCQTEDTGNPNCKLGEAVAEVLHEGMATGDDAGTARLLEPTHGIQPLFQVAVVALHSIVQVLRGPVLSVGNSRAERWRIAFGLVRRHSFRRYTRLVNSPLKERLRRSGVAPLRKVGVNDLAVLVNRPVDVGPRAGKPRVCLIDPPLDADGSSVSPRSFAEKWEEALNPAVDRTAVKDETSLGEPLHDISVAQSIAHVPADSQGDDIIGEGMM